MWTNSRYPTDHPVKKYVTMRNTGMIIMWNNISTDNTARVCVCVEWSGWLNGLVEFLFHNRITTREVNYNAKNVTTWIVISEINYWFYQLPADTMCRNMVILPCFLIFLFLIFDQSLMFSIPFPVGPLFHCSIISSVAPFGRTAIRGQIKVRVFWCVV